jgi:hypothetical protein
LGEPVVLLPRSLLLLSTADIDVRYCNLLTALVERQTTLYSQVIDGAASEFIPPSLGNFDASLGTLSTFTLIVVTGCDM